MSGVLYWAVICVAAAMTIPLIRVLLGPTHFDRLIGLGLVGTHTVILLVAFGAMTFTLELLIDIALSYALISFVGTLALAKYFEQQGEAQK